ncbi:MAG: hypothetical protein HMLIMOIP_001492 [Candidatus Nitrosomirales archaeon]|jgi:hypothetical protein
MALLYGMNKKSTGKKMPVFTCCDRHPSYIVSYLDDASRTIWYVCDQHIKEKAFKSLSVNRYICIEPITAELSKLPLKHAINL